MRSAGSRNRRKGRRSFDILGAIACTASLAVLAVDYRELRAETLEVDLDVDSATAQANFRPGVEWFSVYAAGAKVGFIRTERRVEDNGFSFRTRSELRKPETSAAASVDSQLTGALGQGPIAFEISAQLDEQLQLIAFDGSVAAAGLEVRASATADETQLSGSIEGIGPRLPFTFPLEQRPAFNQSLRPLLLQRDLQAGKRYEFEVFDPFTMQSQATVITYEGLESLDIMGAERQAHHLVQEVAGQRLHVWVNELGEVLREQLPGGFSAIRESEAEALWGLNPDGKIEGPSEDNQGERPNENQPL